MKWTWSLLFALVLTILIVEITGFFLPARMDVERSQDVEAPREEVFALLEDFRTWQEWSPLLRTLEDEPVTPELMGAEQGLGAQMLARYPGSKQILFTIVEHEAPRFLSINVRFGGLDDDLLAGEGFESWDDLTLETLDRGRTRLTWRRRGSELDSYWIRFMDRFVLRSRIEERLQEEVDAVRDLLEGAGN